MTHISGGFAKHEVQNAFTEPGNHSTVVGKAIIHQVRIVRLQSKAHLDEFSKRRAWTITVDGSDQRIRQPSIQCFCH